MIKPYHNKWKPRSSSGLGYRPVTPEVLTPANDPGSNPGRGV